MSPTSEMMRSDFEGKLIKRKDEDYDQHAYQYASTSFEDGSMKPSAIVYAANDDDVRKAIKYASDNKLAIAVRTGGHQYSGASSTSGNNILLDVSEAYEEFEWDATTGLLRVGVSHSLRTLYELMHTNNIFLPYGVCSNVHLGGHVHTGGYGQMARAFGLLGDHVVGIEVITADGEKRAITRDTCHRDEKDLFFAVLGGSPGNFGVLTHVTLKPLLDSNHPNSRGVKLVTRYTPEKVKELLEIMSAMVKEEDFPGDYDYTVIVMSGDFSMLTHFAFPTEDMKMRRWHEEQYGDSDIAVRPPCIMVYLQWANLGGADQRYNPEFFDKIKNACGKIKFVTVDDEYPTPLSELRGEWVYNNVREFDTPYLKRGYVSRSTTLSEDGWPGCTADTIDDVWANKHDGCNVVVQIQHYGGNDSRFRLNGRDSRTSYSWREGTNVIATVDCFYDDRYPGAEATARRWQERNDELMIGPEGCFSRAEDRRVLWASYGDRDMAVVWPLYHSEANYRRLCVIKRSVDPSGIFTPNRFCVGVGGELESKDAVLGKKRKERFEELHSRRCKRLML